MKELRDLAEGLGFEEPKTYIQSGNAVFRSALAGGELAGLIADEIAPRIAAARPVPIRSSWSTAPRPRSPSRCDAC